MRRFSIAGLMLVVLVCAVAVAALCNASDAWAGAMLGLTLLVLGTAILGAWNRRGVGRAFWQGFALLGWGYLALAMGPWFADRIQPALPTTQLLDLVHGRLGDTGHWGYLTLDDGSIVTVGSAASQPGAKVSSVEVLGGGGGVPEAVQTYKTYIKRLVGLPTNREQFVRVGHCLFALLAALSGSLIARWFHRTDRAGATT